MLTDAGIVVNIDIVVVHQTTHKVHRICTVLVGGEQRG